MSASYAPAPHGGQAGGGGGASVAGKQGRDSSMVDPHPAPSLSARADVPESATHAAARGDKNCAQDIVPAPVAPTADAAAAAESPAAQSRAPASRAAAVKSTAENAPLKLVHDLASALPPSVSNKADASGSPSDAADLA